MADDKGKVNKLIMLFPYKLTSVARYSLLSFNHTFAVIVFMRYFHFSILYNLLQRSIVFNATKRETHHPNNGFKKLLRKLRSSFKVST
jgi:hypothetical protein